MNEKEFDSSKEAWKIYELIYSDIFVVENSIKETRKKENNKRIVKKGKFQYNAKVIPNIYFSGETDFNFSMGWAHSRRENYYKVLKNIPLENYSNICIENLNICSNMMKSIVNISLMPVTGNMQSVKKGIANDRIDTFIWALDQYYRGKSNLLMNYASFENAKVLKKYLNIFENANDYCQVIYHINDSLVDELIASGIRTLDKAENIVNYMNLAIKFWKEKIMFFRKHEKIQSDIQVVHELDILDKILLEVRSYF